jgi:hypothetical protein
MRCPPSTDAVRTRSSPSFLSPRSTELVFLPRTQALHLFSSSPLFRPLLPSTSMTSLHSPLAPILAPASDHIPLSTSGSSSAYPASPAAACPTCDPIVSTSPTQEPIIPTYRARIVRSASFPFTRCPTPVPFIRSPFSARRRTRSSVPFTVNGSSSSTPCCRASLTTSACRRSENAGSCLLPVIAWRYAANGDGALSPVVRVLCPGVLVLGAVPSGRMAAGGYRAKNRVSRGGRAVASLTYCRELMVVLVWRCCESWEDVVKSISVRLLRILVFNVARQSLDLQPCDLAAQRHTSDQLPQAW